MKIMMTIVITTIITASVVVALARFTNEYFETAHQSAGYQLVIISQELFEALKHQSTDEEKFTLTEKDNNMEKNVTKNNLNLQKNEDLSFKAFIAHSLAPHFATATLRLCKPVADWEQPCSSGKWVEAGTMGGSDNSAHCHCRF